MSVLIGGAPLRAKVRGLELAYRALGHGPTLVLLHAFPLNQDMWAGQLAGLSDHCHVVTLDLPGFGGSQSTDGDFSLADWAVIVHEFLEHIGHPRAVLGGLSMGGYVALAYARLFGDSLRGLVLADTRAGADTPEAAAQRLSQADEILIHGARGLSQTFPHRAIAPASSIDLPDLVPMLTRQIAGAAPAAVAGALRAMAARPDSTDLLPRLTLPTLVVVGEADGLTPPSEAERMAAAIPGAQLVRIPSAGHLSNLEKPEAFNQALARFMAQFKD